MQIADTGASMALLYTLHSRGLAAAFAEIENYALGQPAVPSGTPGSVLERTNAGGVRFYALQRYGHDGRRSESYLAGPVGDPAADRLATEARAQVGEARDIMASIRLLLREGYAAMPPKPFAAVAALANHSVFRGGAMLVGTHAFEAIVNRMGLRAASFATEDL